MTSKVNIRWAAAREGEWRLPRCDGQLGDQAIGWREALARRTGKQVDTRCSFESEYLVNGRPLCARHAGMVALKLLCPPPATKRRQRP